MKKQYCLRAVAMACCTLMLAGAVASPVAAAPAPTPASATAARYTSHNEGGRWENKDGKRYRYNSEGRLMKGYFVVDGKRYYAQRDGAVVTKQGFFKRSDGKEAYASKNGVIKAGVFKVKKQMYYINRYGLPRNGHFKVNGKWYLTTKGKITKGWNTYKNKKYYVGSRGWLLTGHQTIKGKKYFFDEKGALSEEMLTVTRNGKQVSGPASEILARIVMAEVGGFRNAEVYKAQAIAAHTFLLYNYSNGTKYPSVPDANPTSMCKQAVADVSSMYLTYNGKPIFAPYTASNNGKTNPCKDFWKRDYPYLQSVPSVYDSLSTNFRAQKAIPVAEFRAMMDEVYGAGQYTLSGSPAGWITTQKNAYGYVTAVSVGGRKPTPEYFYQKMVDIRSPAFDVEYNAAQDTLVFTTEGFGHGVGLSQWGAYGYATKAGYSYAQILQHYYPGTKLEK